METNYPGNLHQLAQILNVSYKGLEFFAFKAYLPSFYSRHEIVKYEGKARQIAAPGSYLKALQRKIKTLLEQSYTAPGSTHGFRTGRSIITNARQHVGAAWILNLDLEDFFGSINFGRVLGALRGRPFCFNKQVAVAISRLSTLDNALPLGSPASPILSNIVCRSMDRDLLSVAREYSIFYTRYADDLTFSSRSKKYLSSPGQLPQSLQNTIEDCIQENGFHINRRKQKFYYGSNGGIVTGLRVTSSVTPGRKFIRELRAIYSKIRKEDLKKTQEEFSTKYANRNRYRDRDPSLVHHINGKLSFLYAILGPYHPVYQNYFDRLRSVLPD